MNFILYGLIVCCFTYIGFGLSDYYVKREKLFYQLNRFCEKLKADIAFLQKPLKEILLSAEKEFILLTPVLSACISILDSGNAINAENLYNMLNLRHLEGEEKKLVCGFFSTLGKSDRITQIENIENYLTLFKIAENSCESERKKYSPMFKKMGFICGITICLLII